MKTFSVSYANEPWRNRSFKVRGICKFDVLNPCFNNRKSDKVGMHWSGECKACEACTKEAMKYKNVVDN